MIVMLSVLMSNMSQSKDALILIVVDYMELIVD